MRLRPMNLRVHRVLVVVALLLYVGTVFASAAEARTIGRKEMRDARRAVQEGRLADGLEIYERILKSAATGEQRFESLYRTLLILLSSGADAAAPETVQARLEALAGMVESGEYGNELEIRTLASLVGTVHTLQAGLEALEIESASALAAAQLACDRERGAAAGRLAAQEALVSAERQEKLLLEQRIDLARRHLATREEELKIRVEELGRCTEEMQLVLNQLEGTHASEVQMLQVVMRKNEELAKTRLVLERREKKLAEQGEQLAAKEEEIHKREEAIREVTERVLGKEPPDS